MSNNEIDNLEVYYQDSNRINFQNTPKSLQRLLGISSTANLSNQTLRYRTQTLHPTHLLKASLTFLYGPPNQSRPKSYSNPNPKPPPHIHPLTIHHHPTHPLHTIEQVRSTVKWTSLFSCCFRSWHKSSSKALQITYKSPPKLQEAEDKKGGMDGGVKTYSNDGCHLVILDFL